MKKYNKPRIEYIKGTIYLSDGNEVSFYMDETGFEQSGLEKDKLWFTQPFLEALSRTYAEQIFEIDGYYRDEV